MNLKRNCLNKHFVLKNTLINMQKHYTNAQEAFEDLYDKIIENGSEYIGTRAFFDIGFFIDNPTDNLITTPWRKWNKDYADYEWNWYLSGDRSAAGIEQRAKIWSNMYDLNDPDKKVNSNYGYQWQRNNQLSKITDKLRKDPFTRQACVSIYDGKELELYTYDTPCTLTVSFYIMPNSPDKLNMSVNMRSNDLVFGFCNDQYFFSKLQKMVADDLGLSVGHYYHHAVNLHIYARHYDMKSK